MNSKVNLPAPGGISPETRTDTFGRVFDLCINKSRRNIRRLADDPKSAAWAQDGNYFAFPEGFFEIGNWTSSFFTGMALLAWRETEDEYFLHQTLRLAPAYREKASTRFLDMHHDAGFLYSLYSVALYKLTGDAAHREVGLAAAAALYQRFNHRGGFIRAWGRLDTGDFNNVAIIDGLMNLPLLYWAAREAGAGKYQEAAIRHADTTLNCFVRADDSVVHAYRFDRETGQALGGANFCGAAVDSWWARGTAWAIYGFALSYRYTQDEKYLDAALRLARKFGAELDAEVVPVWDFRLPTNAALVRDASAAAVAVCGIQELQQLGRADAWLLMTKDALLTRICRDDYLNPAPDCPGLLRSAYGDKVAYSSWGDYFLMEALGRELGTWEGFW